MMTGEVGAGKGRSVACDILENMRCAIYAGTIIVQSELFSEQFCHLWDALRTLSVRMFIYSWKAGTRSGSARCSLRIWDFHSGCKGGRGWVDG